MDPARDEPPTSGAERDDPLRDRLRELARLLPEGATVSLDRAALERLAGPLGDDLRAADPGHDCTVAEAAERLRLSQNRVRALIAAGKLEAYRVAGVGGWRVTLAALEAFRRAGGPQPGPQPAPRQVDVRRWRRLRRGEG